MIYVDPNYARNCPQFFELLDSSLRSGFLSVRTSPSLYLICGIHSCVTCPFKLANFKCPCGGTSNFQLNEFIASAYPELAL